MRGAFAVRLALLGRIFYAPTVKEKGIAMANNAPAVCPSCGERVGWKCTGESSKGFSVGKAAAGGLLLGPIGLVGGALGKKKKTYYCQKCGFREDYDA